jgi:hypothetical protein
MGGLLLVRIRLDGFLDGWVFFREYFIVVLIFMGVFVILLDLESDFFFREFNFIWFFLSFSNWFKDIRISG